MLFRFVSSICYKYWYNEIGMWYTARIRVMSRIRSSPMCAE